MRIVDLARRFWFPVSFALVVGLLLLRLHTGATLTPPATPGAAPLFTLSDLQGRRVSLASLRGRPVLVNFFGTWCPPCRAELPELEKLAKAQPGCLRVVGVAEDSGSAQDVLAFAEKRGLTYPLLLDDGSAGSRYEVTSIPRSVLIDADGKLAGSFAGMVTQAGVEQAVHALATPVPRC